MDTDFLTGKVYIGAIKPAKIPTGLLKEKVLTEYLQSVS